MLHSAGERLHGGRGFFQVGCRLLGAVAQILVAVGDFAARGGDVARRFLHLAHQVAQRFLHACHGGYQLTDLVLLLRVHVFSEVAGRNALGQTAGVAQRLRDGAHTEIGERYQHRQPQHQPHANEHGHGCGARLDSHAGFVHLAARTGGQIAQHLVGIVGVLAQAVGIGATAGPIELRVLNLLEDGGDPRVVLLQFFQGLVDGASELRILCLALAHLAQILAQLAHGASPVLTQLGHLDAVVEIDDDVFFNAAHVPQQGAQVRHVGEGLYSERKQLLQGAPCAVQRHIAHGANHDQQHQCKPRAEVQARTDREPAKQIHGTLSIKTIKHGKAPSAASYPSRSLVGYLWLQYSPAPCCRVTGLSRLGTGAHRCGCKGT